MAVWANLSHKREDQIPSKKLRTWIKHLQSWGPYRERGAIARQIPQKLMDQLAWCGQWKGSRDPVSK